VGASGGGGSQRGIELNKCHPALPFPLYKLNAELRKDFKRRKTRCQVQDYANGGVVTAISSLIKSFLRATNNKLYLRADESEKATFNLELVKKQRVSSFSFQVLTAVVVQTMVVLYVKWPYLGSRARHGQINGSELCTSRPLVITGVSEATHHRHKEYLRLHNRRITL
jgi:hypothetical protein